MKLKRFTSILILAAIAFMLLPATARADDASVTYIDGSGTEQTVTAAVVDSSTSTLGTGWYVVNDSGVTRSGTITVSGSVNLILADGASLAVTASTDNVGINVTSGNTLTIYGQSLGTGTLNVTGDEDSSGLGGGDRQGCGTVNVYGGNVTAKGGSYGAGIGGGLTGSGGTLNVYGGTVTATGGEYGAGIGGGYGGGGGTVNVYGGTVTATGGRSGAGIGRSNGGGTVNIHGGTVTATGGGDGAGIGGGFGGDGVAVNVSGGTVTATGGSSGAGIGGGMFGSGGKVTISGGMVTAKGGSFAAGIGGGDGDPGGNVTISGGMVTATGGNFGAGIGGGYGDNGGAVVVSGGSIKAQGTGGGAAIGAGKYGSGGTLKNANGDNVYLTTVTVMDGGAAVASSDISLLSWGAGSTYYAYGANDVKTNASGKLYLYLPAGTAAMAAKTPAPLKYSGSVTANTSSGVLAPDTQPPVVTSVEPAGQYAPLDGSIVITFDEEVIDGTGTVSISSGGEYTALAGGTWSAGNTVYTLPYAGLSNRTHYTVKVDGFRDANNNVMASADTSHTFRTTPPVYTITYDLAGGTISTPNPASFTDEGADFTFVSPTRAGYTFTGWSGTGIAGINPSVTIPFGSTGDRAYTAHWTANDYTLTFDAQGGTVSPESITVTYDAVVGALPMPGRTGYSFAGWFTEASGAGSEYTEETVYRTDGNSMLYACWTANDYTLAFDAQGGTVSPESITVTYDAAVGELPTPERTGYTFAGWFTEASGAGTQYTADTVYQTAGDLTLHACWTLNTYALAYDLAGGTAINPESYTVEDIPLTLANPSRVGYTFTGWSGTDIDGTTLNLTIPANSTGDREYTAHWTANDYTLSFYAQGGVVSPESITMTYDAAVGELPTPVRTGYTFEGWFTAAGGAGSEYTEETVYQTDGDLMLHAYWTPTPYALAYDLAGDAANNPVSYTVEVLPITLENPSRVGYTFAGWSGTDIDETTLSVTIPANSIGDRVYTAHWTLNTYSIRYDLDGGTLDEPNPDSYTVKSGAITLNNPEKEGYTFVGWSGTGVSGMVMYVTIPAGSWGNRKYIGHWEQNPVYIAQTLVDDSSGISVSGDNIREDAVLTVTELNLGDSEACDAIRQRMDDGDYVFLLGKNISLSGGFTGMISISLPVGTQYDGKTVTVLHCNNGELENYTVIVKDRMATIQVSGLSPFAVFAEVDDTQPDSTETVSPSPSPSHTPAVTAVPANADDTVNPGGGIGLIWWLLGGLVLVGVILLVVFIRHRRA